MSGEAEAGFSAGVAPIQSGSGAARAAMIGSLYLIAVLNGFAADVVNTVRAQGLWPALYSTFGLSVVSVGAVVCGLTLVRRSSARPIGMSDLVLAGTVVCLVLLPSRAASWTAVSLLAAYELARPRSGTPERTGAAVFLALAASEFWVPVVIQASGSLWLSWDAALVTVVLRAFGPDEVIRAGNLISLADGGSIAIVTACASLTNVAYGLLCWLVIAKSLCATWNRLDVGAVAIIVASVVALNVGRVALMASDPDRYDLIHGVVGGDVFNVVLLIVSAATALWTVRYSSVAVEGCGPAAGDREPLRQGG